MAQGVHLQDPAAHGRHARAMLEQLTNCYDLKAKNRMLQLDWGLYLTLSIGNLGGLSLEHLDQLTSCMWK